MPKHILEIKSATFVKVLFIALFLFITLLSFFIIRPFVNALLASLIFSYLFYPIYKRLYKKTGKRNLSAFIVTSAVILLLIILLFLVAGTLGREVISLIGSSGWITTIAPSSEDCADQTTFICMASKQLSSFIANRTYQGRISTVINAIPILARNATDAAFLLIKLGLNIFIIFFVMFFIYRDGKHLKDFIEPILPLSIQDKKRIFTQFNDLTYAIVYGNLMTAALQGLATALGFYLFGISSPILWGALASFFALVPFIGAVIIWLPAGISLLVRGYLASHTYPIFNGIGLLIYGIFIISMIDNILKPKLIGDRANIHPVLVLLGVMGGLGVFGFIGVILGPIILAFFITFTKIFKKDILKR